MNWSPPRPGRRRIARRWSARAGSFWRSSARCWSRGAIRDCRSGLLARALLSSACGDLAGLLREVAADLAALGVAVEGVISDGQHSLRLAIARVWPDVPHQLCHFHYLREAALPIYEADRHAKKELKKTVRGIRPIGRGPDR